MDWQSNTKEYERILNLYSNDVYRMALLKMRNTQDAEDIFQNVFIKLYTSGKTFQSDSHIKAWLLKVTVNDCINALKSSWNSKVTTGYGDINSENSGNSDSNKDYSANQFYSSNNFYNNVTYDDTTSVWNEVSRLPQKYRDVIYLYYHEEYSTEEIASILGILKPNVHTRLKRAREILRKEVADYEF